VASRDQYATFKTPSYLKFALFKKNQSTLVVTFNVSLQIKTVWSGITTKFTFKLLFDARNSFGHKVGLTFVNCEVAKIEEL
jgi:hypothetical protein